MPENSKWNPAPEPGSRRWVRCRAHPKMYDIAWAVSRAYRLTLPLSWELLLNYAFWGKSPEQVIQAMFVASGRCSPAATVLVDPLTGSVVVVEPVKEADNA